MSGELAHVRAVVFDVDGTLYHQKPVQRGMLRRLALGHLARPWRGPRTLRALSTYRKGQEALRASGEAFGDLADAQVRFAAERTGVPAAEVASLVRLWMEQKPLDLVARAKRDGLDRLLEGLGARGVRLGVFSDYPPEAKLEALGVRSFFDVVVWAQQPDVGRFKPDPLGIRLAAERLGASLDVAAYVGDRIEVDAQAAEAAGMSGAILGPPGDGPTYGAHFASDCAELARLFGS